MKNIYFILFFLLFSIFSIHSQVSREKAFDIVKKEILKDNTDNIHLYANKDIIPASFSIKTMSNDVISPKFSSWMFFLDEDPYQNWGHPAKFIFVDQNGQYEIIAHNYPPSLSSMDILIEKKIDIPAYKYKITEKSKVSPKNITTANNEYAVIISGGWNKENNYERYWNDCSFIYSTLIHEYGYSKSHIYVLMADGTNSAADRRRLNGTYDSSPLDLDGDGVADIGFSATRANITAVFNTLSNTLTANDNLFIFTTDHGGRNSGNSVYMCLWNETKIQDTEFATEVNKVTAKSINIVMKQCNSGGFIDNLAAANRVIATACEYDESSYAMPPNYQFNEFVYYWTSAVAGETPFGTAVNADVNADGYISTHETFQYAKNHDTRSESPQYSSSPSSFGNELCLIGFIPAITGSNVVYSTPITFTLNDSYVGNWSVTNGFQITSNPTNVNSVTVMPTRYNGQGEH